MCLNPILTIKTKGKIQGIKELPKFKTKREYEKFFEIKKSERLVELPCGKCQECKKAKYMEWLKRIKKELTFHKKNYMLTLTYDNEHITKLNKEDLQLFFKRMRKQNYFVRYWYVGELGETTQRPHYHCIMFGLKPKDLKESKRETKKGYKQYESKEIEQIWGNGLVTLSEMNIQTIHYVLKYLTKNKGKKDFLYGMSKKPPIGINPETIEEDILKRTRTKGEKNYYKHHIGEIPIIESEEKDKLQKIEEIEKQTKLKYYNYIKQKRKSAKNIWHKIWTMII